MCFGEVFVAGGEALDEKGILRDEVFEEGSDSKKGRSWCALLTKGGGG